MDQRERYVDESETLRLAMESWQTRVWTALPGVIKQFPAASGIGSMIADIQPVINGRIRTLKGTFQSMQMPVLLDCPILWQGGGGMTLTFPIKAGDECLVIFSARCIDAWWQQGFVPGQAGIPVDGKQPMDPPDLRMHNLSDGFALIGVRSLPKNFTPDNANVSLQTDDGSFFWKLNPTTKAISATASGGINLNGVTIDSSGNVNSPATITASTNVIGNGTSLHTHVHTDPQGGDTGPPV
jgi:hypothetical protein